MQGCQAGASPWARLTPTQGSCEESQPPWDYTALSQNLQPHRTHRITGLVMLGNPLRPSSPALNPAPHSSDCGNTLWVPCPGAEGPALPQPSLAGAQQDISSDQRSDGNCCTQSPVGAACCPQKVMSVEAASQSPTSSFMSSSQTAMKKGWSSALPTQVLRFWKPGKVSDTLIKLRALSIRVYVGFMGFMCLNQHQASLKPPEHPYAGARQEGSSSAWCECLSGSPRAAASL